LSSAYLLISHGSRDPRPQQAIDKLAGLVRAQLQLGAGNRRVGNEDAKFFPELGAARRSTSHPLTSQANLVLQRTEATPATGRATVVNRACYPLVGTATLELGYAPLHEQIWQFADKAVAEGYNQIQLLPLFLLPGVHVREDIPHEVVLAQQRLGSSVVLNQRPYIGACSGLGRLMASQWAMIETDAKILLSHGTRRQGGNEPVEAVAAQLGAVAAYWSVPPIVETQVDGLVTTGHKRIGILPYFLFPGGITDAIAQKVDSLQAQFPTVELRLGEPIGASATLANLIVDLIKQ
jgi:sirohydrochlorin cobaltochelatase